MNFLQEIFNGQLTNGRMGSIVIPLSAETWQLVLMRVFSGELEYWNKVKNRIHLKALLDPRNP